MLEPSVIVDSGAKAVCASLGGAEEVNVLTEFVRLLLHKSSAHESMKFTLGLGLSYNDPSVGLFLEKIARARLPKEPSVVDEPEFCAPGCAQTNSRILRNQPRYIATASLPNPKNRNKA